MQTGIEYCPFLHTCSCRFLLEESLRDGDFDSDSEL